MGWEGLWWGDETIIPLALEMVVVFLETPQTPMLSRCLVQGDGQRDGDTVEAQRMALQNLSSVRADI